MGKAQKLKKERQEQDEAMKKAFDKFRKFTLNMIVEDGFSIVPLYFDNAFEGTRTYQADFRIFPSTEEDRKQAKEVLENLDKPKTNLELV